jgi:hypothetical protein
MPHPEILHMFTEASSQYSVSASAIAAYMFLHNDALTTSEFYAFSRDPGMRQLIVKAGETRHRQSGVTMHISDDDVQQVLFGVGNVYFSYQQRNMTHEQIEEILEKYKEFRAVNKPASIEYSLQLYIKETFGFDIWAMP